MMDASRPQEELCSSSTSTPSLSEMKAVLLAEGGGAETISQFRPEELQVLHRLLHGNIHSHARNEPSIPILWLDRSSLSQRASDFPIFRHVGMVQDMLDPEYYYDSKNCAAGASSSQQLAERQPLVVVPLPFGARWSTRRRIRSTDTGGNTPAVVIPESPPTTHPPNHSTKRSREDDCGLSLPSTPTTSRPRREADDMDLSSPHSATRTGSTSTTTPTSSSSSPNDTRIHGQESDWWPAGHWESAAEESPVLAQLYYEAYPNLSSTSEQEERLKLNDVVETIGWMDMNPTENLEWEETFLDEFGMGTSSGYLLPPPSRLPRFHVLAFRKLDLDQDDNDGSDSDSYSDWFKNSQNVHEDRVKDPLQDWTKHWTTMPSSFFDATCAEALFLTLCSKAERKQGAMQRTPAPDQMALGSASLQLLSDQPQALYERLKEILSKICPVLTALDFTTKKCSADYPYPLVPPTKQEGRLQPSPWQLPKGSTFLLRVSQSTPLLEELCRQHQISYRFEGGVRIPFEADYRIIVVSEASTKKLPGCTFTLQVRNSVEEMEWERDDGIMDQLAAALRNGRGRSPDSIRLSTNVLEQAQAEFLHRRQHARQRQGPNPPTTTTTTTDPSRIDDLPREQDFHRWLTLTRMYARARGRAEATTTDWESALALDDAIRLS